MGAHGADADIEGLGRCGVGPAGGELIEHARFGGCEVEQPGNRLDRSGAGCGGAGDKDRRRAGQQLPGLA